MRTGQVIEGLDSFHARISASQGGFLSLLAEADELELWRDEGARDTAHWVSLRYGISWWKADRWVEAAHALETLPKIAEAFSTGVLSIDKVVELVRFATPETQERLIRWAQGVSAGAIRRRADVEARPQPDDAAEAERDRYLDWWWLEGGLRLALQGELPAADGAAIVRAIERRAARIPRMPGEEHPANAPARRADALVALRTEGSTGSQPETTVVIHSKVEGFESNGEIEGGGVVHPRTLQRMLCAAKVEDVLEDDLRNPLALGRTTREPSKAMMRALRYRDQECRFPDCQSTRYTVAHHLLWWPDRPGQPAPALHVPPQTGARVRLEGRESIRRSRRVALSQRGPVPGGAAANRGGTLRAQADRTRARRRGLTSASP
jgi:Domain of unknown function (DUF222)